MKKILIMVFLLASCFSHHISPMDTQNPKKYSHSTEVLLQQIESLEMVEEKRAAKLFLNYPSYSEKTFQSTIYALRRNPPSDRFAAFSMILGRFENALDEGNSTTIAQSVQEIKKAQESIGWFEKFKIQSGNWDNPDRKILRELMDPFQYLYRRSVWELVECNRDTQSIMDIIESINTLSPCKKSLKESCDALTVSNHKYFEQHPHLLIAFLQLGLFDGNSALSRILDWLNYNMPISMVTTQTIIEQCPLSCSPAHLIKLATIIDKIKISRVGEIQSCYTIRTLVHKALTKHQQIPSDLLHDYIETNTPFYLTELEWFIQNGFNPNATRWSWQEGRYQTVLDKIIETRKGDANILDTTQLLLDHGAICQYDHDQTLVEDIGSFHLKQAQALLNLMYPPQ